MAKTFIGMKITPKTTEKKDAKPKTTEKKDSKKK